MLTPTYRNPSPLPPRRHPPLPHLRHRSRDHPPQWNEFNQLPTPRPPRSQRHLRSHLPDGHAQPALRVPLRLRSPRLRQPPRRHRPHDRPRRQYAVFTPTPLPTSTFWESVSKRGYPPPASSPQTPPTSNATTTVSTRHQPGPPRNLVSHPTPLKHLAPAHRPATTSSNK